MCAINGFNFKDAELITAMNSVTKHRGPDGTGIFTDEKISLGHNRLSIIDLSEEANQPMYSEDKEIILTYNGELYNFKELRSELENFYVFRTESDSEVVLAAYKRWGSKCVDRFNGIFAFAIWDVKKKELFFARDQVGVKPLYYYFKEGVFIFSSEIKGVLEHNIPRILNTEAFEHYFRVLYVPEPLTLFRDVFKVPPGHKGTLSNNELRIERYYSLDGSKVVKKVTKEEVRQNISSSVKRQLVSDRPVGIYLSGGIDSSIVLDVMSLLRKDIQTFSIGFSLKEDEESEKFNKDFYLARKTAEKYHTQHHEVLLSHTDVVDALKEAIYQLDEPIANPTLIAQYKLAEFVKNEGVDVVLGGDGGDELFGGYERYRIAYFMSLYQKCIPSSLRKMLSYFSIARKLNTEEGIDQFELFMFQKDSVLKRVIAHKYVNSRTKEFFSNKYFKKEKGVSPEALLMDIDIRSWLVDESLLRTDKMSMAFGLEARVPLLDTNTVSFAHIIPVRQKITLRDTKVILKEAFKGRLPEYLFTQPKRGWFSPGAKWLRYEEVYNLAKEVLSPTYHTSTQNLFNWSEIQNMLDAHYDKREYNLTILWALISFQVWVKKYNVIV